MLSTHDTHDTGLTVGHILLRDRGRPPDGGGDLMASGDRDIVMQSWSRHLDPSLSLRDRIRTGDRFRIRDRGHYDYTLLWS